MRGDRLVCGSCSGPVLEARCPVCRATRDELRRRTPEWYAWVVGVLLAITATIALLGYYTSVA